MKPPTMYAWTGALRSGKYKQMMEGDVPNGTYLCSHAIPGGGSIPEGATFSAVGVLYHLAGLEVSRRGENYTERAAQWLGTKRVRLDAQGVPNVRDTSTLYDSPLWHEHYNHSTFEQIADLYEYFGIHR